MGGRTANKNNGNLRKGMDTRGSPSRMTFVGKGMDRGRAMFFFFFLILFGFVRFSHVYLQNDGYRRCIICFMQQAPLLRIISWLQCQQSPAILFLVLVEKRECERTRTSATLKINHAVASVPRVKPSFEKMDQLKVFSMLDLKKEQKIMF